jgi:hypothetical protein
VASRRRTVPDRAHGSPLARREAANLDTHERWLQAVVMHPHGAVAGIRSNPARRLIVDAARDIESVILPSKNLSAEERLEIYAHMYYARLIEILVAEYPTTRKILGAEAFAAASRRFLQLHPSRSRTLNHLSEGFPDFLSRHLARCTRHALAVDVARIERAMEDVFDAPRAEPLTTEQLAGLGPEEWHRIRLVVAPALKFLKLRYPANDYMNAVRAGEKPRLPRARPTFAIVYRHDYQVYRRDQDAAQFKLLQALASGRTLAQAVRTAARGKRIDADDFAARLGSWFGAWAAAGLFCGIDQAP